MMTLGKRCRESTRTIQGTLIPSQVDLLRQPQKMEVLVPCLLASSKNSLRVCGTGIGSFSPIEVTRQTLSGALDQWQRRMCSKEVLPQFSVTTSTETSSTCTRLGSCLSRQSQS